MLNISGNDVINLRNSGGDVFTHFVDSLIQANAYIDGISLGNVETNIRNTIADGGVDTKVNVGSQNSEVEWMKDKAIWQYKASAYSGGVSGLVDEVSKPFSSECIRNNFAYRYCVCDSMPSQTKKQWEDTINSTIKGINTNSPKAYVITADDLATWANRFPSIILTFFRPTAYSLGIHFEAWKRNVTRSTLNYVEVPQWKHIMDSIMEQVKFESVVPDVLLTIQGEAGVGKTRLVYESIKKMNGSENILIYSNDENNALQLAHIVANLESTKAILVADECSLRTRLKIKSVLEGHISRVRVIAIDNTGERPQDLSYEYWLEKMDQDFLENILQRNFPLLDRESIRTYAEVSGGFIRLAADLCSNDSTIKQQGHLGAGLVSVRNYYLSRLSQDERKIVEMVSLFSKIGFKEDVRYELESICRLVNIDPEHVIEVTRRIQDVPGFITIAGRYIYVTPELIAQVAFDISYQRWINDDINSFISSLPETLKQSFIFRVGWSAGEVVRRKISDYFCQWIISLSINDLSSIKTVDQLEAIIEADPSNFKQLRLLVETASNEEIFNLTGESEISGRWGARRYLVWMAERFSAFEEHFYDAEFVLRKFAVNENEDISNNATNTWINLFSIMLSGSSLNFNKRFELLMDLIYSHDSVESELAVKALDHVFYPKGYKIVGKSIVGGKLVPLDWSPNNLGEYLQCIRIAINTLIQMKNHNSLKKQVYNIAINHFRQIFNYGFIIELKEILSGDWGDILDINTLLTEIRDTLHYDCKDGNEAGCNILKNWYEEIKPIDTIEKIKDVIGTSYWHYSMRDKEANWEEEINSLAQQLIEQPLLLTKTSDWLLSDKARNAFKFGQALGVHDKELIFLDNFLQLALKCENISLIQGYIRTIVDNVELKTLKMINEEIDKIQQSNPQRAFLLFIAGGSKTDSLNRTILLFDKALLEPICFSHFIQGLTDRELSVSEYLEILNRLYKSSGTGKDNLSIQIMYDMICFIFVRSGIKLDALQHQEMLNLVWMVLRTFKPTNSSGVYDWSLIMKVFLSVDVYEAAKIFVNYIGDDDLTFEQHVIDLFVETIQIIPNECMNYLGDVLLESKKSYRFFIRDYKEIVASFPAGVVISWINAHGVTATRLLARHVPAPYIDENGNPSLHKLTEFMLQNYGDDERTFSEFIAGIHSYQVYSGDIVAKYEREAELARKFLHHRISSVRKWASIEMQNAQMNAERWRIHREEMDLK